MLIHASRICEFMQFFPALNSYNFTIMNPKRTVKGMFPELCSFRSGSSTLAQTQNPYKPQKCGIFLSIFSNYMLCGVVFCAIIKYEDLV